MKSTKRRALYVIAALLGALFILACLAGFAACGGGSNDEDDATVSTVSISGATSVEEGKTVTLTASVTMSDNSSYTGSYTWSSTGTAVTLSSSTTSTVTVTGVTAGSSDITVTAGGVTSAKYTVSVTEAAPDEPTVQSVSITPTSTSLNLYESKTATLTASVTMSENTASYSGEYAWSSSDTSQTYVKLTSNGATATVEAVSATTEAVTITATAGGKSGTCSVTVTADTVKTAAGLSDALASGGSVSLTDNITLADSSSALEVKADTTIDLAGNSISADTSWALPADDQSGFRSDALITVDAGATLTVTDSAASGTTGGSISYDVTGSTIAKSSGSSDTYAWNSSVNYGAAIEVAEGGSLIVEGGTIESSSVGVRAEGVDSSSSEARASVTISGGTISSTYYSIWASGDADVTIEEGATVTSTDKGICIGGDSNFGYSTYQSNTKTTLTITGGEVSCTNESAICTLGVGSNKSAEITITGGTITSSAKIVYKKNDTTGEDTQTVDTAAPAIYLPTGTLTITGGKIVSENLTAVEVRGGIAKISGGELIGESKAQTGEENKGDDASPDKSGSKTYGYALSVYPYGKVSRTGYTESDNAVDVTVTAGTFDGDIYVAAESQNEGSDGNKWTVALNDENAEETAPYVVTINMSLGFKKTAYGSDGNPTCESSGDISYYVFSVTVTSASDESTLTQALTTGGEIVLTADIEEMSTSLTVSADAEIDLAGKSISTGTLSSALNTIEVSANATLTIIDSTGTGTIVNTYTGANGNTSTDNAAAIEVAEGGTLVIESGTIESTSVGVKAEGVTANSSDRATVTIDGGEISSTYFSIWASGDADVTINGGSISGTDKGICIGGDSNYGYDAYQTGTKTTLTVTGGEVSCTNDSAICTLGVGSNASAEITISGGTITSSATPVIDETTEEVITSCPAIYLPTGTLTITGGTISGTTAVEVRGGKVNISGGTLACLYYDEETGEIVGQGDDASQSKSGAKTYGYALSVYPYGKVSRTGYQESDNAVDVTVTAGTFDGDIYVAAQSQNAGSNGSKWTVVLNGQDTEKQNASYVVTITLEETAYAVTTTAYDAQGKVVVTDSSAEGYDANATVSYYIITVSAASIGSGN